MLNQEPEFKEARAAKTQGNLDARGITVLGNFRTLSGRGKIAKKSLRLFSDINTSAEAE
jgi:hypothetical protein